MDAVWTGLKPEWREALGSVIVRGEQPSPALRDALLPMARYGYLDGDTVRPKSLILEWAWVQRLDGDTSELESRLPALGELKGKGVFSKLLGRG